MVKEIPNNRNKYTPTQREMDMIQWVSKRKHQMEDSKERQRALKIWDQGEKQWAQWRSQDRREDWQANYVVPMTTSVVESTLSEMIEELPQPFIIPRGDEDEPRARVMQAIFEYTWDVANGDDEMMKIMRGSLIHGTAIAQEYYLQDKRIVQDIIGMGKKNKKRKSQQFETKEREVLEYDNVLMEWVYPQDVLFDENAREVNRGIYKARDCIRRYVMSYWDADSFFKNSPIFNNLNNWRFVTPGGQNISSSSEGTFQSQFFPPPQGFDMSEDIEILWYWSRTPEDLLVIIANGIPVRIGPNFFDHKQLPFAKAIDVERLGRFYGKGEPELLNSIQSEVNLMRNMIHDRNHLDIDKTFIVSQNTVLDEDDLIARPHGIIVADDPKSVQALEYNDIPLSVERTLNAINEDKIAVTGVDDRFTGIQKAPSTATEASILKESTLKRIRMKITNYQKRFLVDIGRMRMSNIIQFYTQPKLEKIVGQRGTADFKREVNRLVSQGLLEMKGKELFRRSFKQITTEGKKLIFDERGKIRVRREPGFHFFEARPEFFLPSVSEGFDIRFESGPSLPVSKPLLQQRMTEMFDRLLPLAAGGESAYDADKLADALVKVNDLNPEDLKREEEVAEQSIEENRLGMIIDIAAQENQLVLENKPIPENGTPFAPPAHTQIHLQFMMSDQMKQAPQEIFEKLQRHAQGELILQDKRGQAQAAPQAGGGQLPALSDGQQSQAAIPALVQGGGQVPTGQAINPTNV